MVIMDNPSLYKSIETHLAAHGINDLADSKLTLLKGKNNQNNIIVTEADSTGKRYAWIRVDVKGDNNQWIETSTTSKADLKALLNCLLIARKQFDSFAKKEHGIAQLGSVLQEAKQMTFNIKSIGTTQGQQTTVANLAEHKNHKLLVQNWEEIKEAKRGKDAEKSYIEYVAAKSDKKYQEIVKNSGHLTAPKSASKQEESFSNTVANPSLTEEKLNAEEREEVSVIDKRQLKTTDRNNLRKNQSKFRQKLPLTNPIFYEKIKRMVQTEHVPKKDLNIDSEVRNRIENYLNSDEIETYTPYSKGEEAKKFDEYLIEYLKSKLVADFPLLNKELEKPNSDILKFINNKSRKYIYRQEIIEKAIQDAIKVIPSVKDFYWALPLQVKSRDKNISENQADIILNKLELKIKEFIYEKLENKGIDLTSPSVKKLLDVEVDRYLNSLRYFRSKPRDPANVKEVHKFFDEHEAKMFERLKVSSARGSIERKAAELHTFIYNQYLTGDSSDHFPIEKKMIAKTVQFIIQNFEKLPDKKKEQIIEKIKGIVSTKEPSELNKKRPHYKNMVEKLQKLRIEINLELYLETINTELTLQEKKTIFKELKANNTEAFLKIIFKDKPKKYGDYDSGFLEILKRLIPLKIK
ncbi:MAG: hypothetical protein K0S74_602 [Chlamydiales bacterium]|jgi:hypothetical protein|nr:hypothetical protein [Chlamydiales bacterium]